MGGGELSTAEEALEEVDEARERQNFKESGSLLLLPELAESGEVLLPGV